MAVHFTVAWFFLANGLLYLTGIFGSGHWRQIWPGRTPSPFNPMQRLAYTGVVALGMCAAVSGFALYKPVQLSWLTALFGGYQGARLVHFAVMIAFAIFILVHVVQVARAGWNTFRGMVAGFEVTHEE
jgi:thiosulfate reductase cytochrome b subunit